MLDILIQVVFLGLLLGGLVALSIFLYDALKERYKEWKRRQDEWKIVRDYIKKLPVKKKEKK
jgi:hypothetical protein